MKPSSVKKQDVKLTLYYDVSVLTQLLSPLEIKAWTCNYEPFVYLIDGRLVRFNRPQCRKLLSYSLRKLQFIRHRLRMESEFPLYQNRELFLKSHLSEHPLSNRFINGMFKANCHCVEDVLQLGYRRLMNARGIGEQSLKEFEALLVKYKCRDLLK